MCRARTPPKAGRPAGRGGRDAGHRGKSLPPVAAMRTASFFVPAGRRCTSFIHPGRHSNPTDRARELHVGTPTTPPPPRPGHRVHLSWGGRSSVTRVCVNGN